MNDAEGSERASATKRRRVFGAIGRVVVVAVVGLALTVPLIRRLGAKAECLEAFGNWNGDVGACDYGPGGAVLHHLQRSKRCHDAADSHFRECAYSVERLRIDIIGVGSTHASFSVDGSDEKLGYGVGFFTGEGCIRVAPGDDLKARDPMRRIEDGFISTWTGDVYDSLTVCGAEGRNVRAAGETSERER